MFLRSLIIFSIVFIAVAKSEAETLQSLAQKSMIVLVLADEVSLQKKCHFKPENISTLSQKLKSAVDRKISTLTDKDLSILSQRAGSCENDCSCAIYALGFEMKNKTHQMLNDKARKETATDRLRCISKVKDVCSVIQKI